MKTEELLLFLKRNDLLTMQIQTKPQGTFVYVLTKLFETFSLKEPLVSEKKWKTIGLAILELRISVFTLNQK